jgi:hypothetical protein
MVVAKGSVDVDVWLRELEIMMAQCKISDLGN